MTKPEEDQAPEIARVSPTTLATFGSKVDWTDEEDVVSAAPEEAALELSEDQAQALDVLLNRLRTTQDKALVLTGPAGCGKTTLAKELIRQLHKEGRFVVGAAPTGKAALRFGQVTRLKASTMHSLLYRERVTDLEGDMHFSRPQPPCEPGEVVLIDEASMIGSKLYNDFMSKVPDGAQVVFLGDKEQLSPVKDTWGANLENPTARLTQVHRQALDNPVLAFATAVRCGEARRWLSEWANKDDRLQVLEDEDLVAWLEYERKQKSDATCLTYTHGKRKLINDKLRHLLGHRGLLVEGDLVVVKANNRASGYCNGEVLTVTSVGPVTSHLLLLPEYGHDPDEFLQVTFDDEEAPWLIRKALIEAPPGAFWSWKESLSKHDPAKDYTLHIHYGQCLTVHASQGSQWNSVGFQLDSKYRNLAARDPDEGRRMLYTAATRASDRLYLFING